MYFIGIDGCGNYSRLLAINDEQNIIGRHVGKKIHPEHNTGVNVKQNLLRLIEEFNKLTNTKVINCGGVCIGFNSVLSDNSISELKQIIEEHGFSCPVNIVTEAEMILASEAKKEPGVVVLSNNASVCYAIDKNKKIKQIGGWGFMIDDVGSACWLGKTALKYACLSFDGMIGKTVLIDKIKEHLAIKNFEDCAKIVAKKDFSPNAFAELALTVKYAAKGGDKIAQDIEEEAAQGLYKAASVLIGRSKLEKNKVILSGSVFSINDKIKERVTELLKNEFKGITVITTKEKPELGAAFLAYNKATQQEDVKIENIKEA